MSISKSKIKHWLRRYWHAEVIGTISAVIFPTAATFVSENIVLIALAGTWGENIGFYGTMIVQEMVQTRRKYQEENKKYGYLAAMKSIRNIFLEFGAAETIDSFLTRPAAMYFTVSIFQNMQLGVLVGKVIADVIFYIPTVISYELRKKHLGD